MSGYSGLSDEQVSMIRSFFPQSCEVKLFGSRVRGNFRVNSDLDVCIISDIARSELVKIQECFEESNLPFTVDVVLYRDCSVEFKKIIDTTGVDFDIIDS